MSLSFVVRNLPAILLWSRSSWACQDMVEDFSAERLLSWILLLPIGVTGLWAGVTHVAFPTLAASYIGWETSPFQFEVGMADLAIGVTAVISFGAPCHSRPPRSAPRPSSYSVMRLGTCTR